MDIYIVNLLSGYPAARYLMDSSIIKLVLLPIYHERQKLSERKNLWFTGFH